jgi:hypothetical protein
MDIVADGRLAAAVLAPTVLPRGGSAVENLEEDGCAAPRSWQYHNVIGFGPRPREAFPVAITMRFFAAVLSFGDVRPHSGKIKRAGALLICQVLALSIQSYS